MKITWHIFLREYLERVRTKSFVILTLLMPVIFAALFAGPILLMGRSSKTQKVAIVDLDGRLAAALEQRLTERREEENDPQKKIEQATSGRRNVFLSDRYEMRRVAVEPGQEDTVKAQLSRQVTANQLDAYVWFAKDAVAAGSADYYARNLTDMGGIETMRRAVSQTITRMRLVDKGVPSGEIEALLKNIRLRTLRVTETGAKEDRGLGGFLLSFFFTMVLYSTLIFYGVAVMRGIIEEKSSRIFEVLLSSVKPIQLMAGKILGLAAVGLTQYLVWAIMIGLAGGGFGIAALSQLGEMNVTPLMLGAFVVYFLLGYVLYSALYAALGAAVNTEQEAQQLQFFVVILLVAPLILQQMVMRNPSSTASVALSLVPFFAPLLMFLRITIQTPPAWQLALSVALMIATGALVMWACARIYRVGILMYGKRPTLPELWRWFRTA